MPRDHHLAPLVTARDARKEPFHRWLVFKQAFSPELVRQFLREHELDPDRRQPWLLDPFAGTGTFVTECARQRIRAIGVELLSATAFVARCKSARNIPEPPDLTGCNTWRDIAPHLTEPIHRSALICAVASRLTAEGKVNKNAPPVTNAFNDVLEMMREDVRNPLPLTNPILQGDGRTLDCVADGSVGGILTSPPYLSRHDYTRITKPFEEVYAHWQHNTKVNQWRRQLPAHARAATAPVVSSVPDNAPSAAVRAVNETAAVLENIGDTRLASVVRSYFRDMFQVLNEFSRVLTPGAPCWIIIAGARLKDVHVPTDVIIADHAREAGFDVQELRVARNVVPSGRRFGTLTNVAPRESIIAMRKC
jgi:hypothetical protein